MTIEQIRILDITLRDGEQSPPTPVVTTTGLTPILHPPTPCQGEPRKALRAARAGDCLVTFGDRHDH